jgi:hypothetical protein
VIDIFTNLEHAQLETLIAVRRLGFSWNPYSCCNAVASVGSLDILEYARDIGCWGPETCAITAKHGHLELLQWLKAQRCPWNRQTCVFAAENGHLEVLQWAFANGCSFKKDALVCSSAAKNEHLQVIQWARQNGAHWTAETAQQAA